MASPAARPATPPPPPATAGSSPERYIEQQLARTRRRLKLVDFFGASMLLLAGVLAYLLALALVDHWIVDLGFWGRLLGLIALVAGSFWYSLRVLLPLLLRPINPAYAAWAIERSAPSLKNSLINFLLFRSHRSELREAIYRALEHRAASDLAHVPIENAIDRSKVIQVGYALAAILAICALYTIISPKDPFQTMARVAMPWANIVRPSRVQIEEVKPANAQVLQGETVEVVATILGARPSDTVTLYYSTADRQIVERPVVLEPDANGWHYRCQLPPEADSGNGPYEGGLQQDIQYRIEAGDAVTPDYILEVVAAPMMVVERVQYEYPGYTQRPPRIAAQGDITALEGTQVTVYARANQPIRQASLELDPAEDGQRASATLPMKPRQLEASRTFTLLMDSTGTQGKYSRYQVRFVNHDGRVSQHPVLHNIEVTPDLPPLIEVLTPQEFEVEVPLAGQQLIEVRAVDPDYGLSRVTLRGLAADQVVLDETLLQDEDGYQGQAMLRFIFQPSRLGLEVGDQLRVTATAEDHRTDPLTKEPAPNSETTPSYLFKIVAGPEQSAAEQANSEAEQGATGQAAESAETPQQQTPEETPETSQSQDPAAQQPQTGQEADQQSDQQQNQQGEQQSGDSQTQGQDQQQQQGQQQQQQGQAEQQQGAQAGREGGQQQGNQESSDTQGGATGNTGTQQQQGQRHAQPPTGAQQQSGGQQPSGNQQGTQQQTGPTRQGRPDDPGAQQGAEQNSTAGSRGAESGERQEELHPGEAFEKINDFRKRQQQQAEGQQGQGQPQGAQQEGAQNANSPNPGKTGPEGTQAQPQSVATDTQPAGSDGQMKQGSNLRQNGQPQPNDPSTGSRSANETQGTEGQNQQRSPLGPPESREQPGEGSVPTEGTDRQPEHPTGSQNQPNRADEARQPASVQGSNATGEDKPSDPGAGQAGDPNQASPDAVKQNADRSKQQESEKMEKPEHEQPPGVSTGKRQSDSQGQDSGEESGGGRQGGGQNTQQQGHDSPGSSSSADEGRGASSESGAGETSQQAGDKQPGQGANEGSGNRPQPGHAAPQGAGGLPQDGQQQEPSSAQEAGAGGSGQQGKAGSRKGNPSSKTAGGSATGGGGLPPDREAPAVQQDQDVPDGDKADLEYARQATEMALEYLEEQQHDPDPELLKELGWSADELREFLADWQRMKQQAVEGERGEQEYEEVLRSLGLRPGEQRMRQGVRADDRIRGMREGGARTAPPPQFRDQFDAYRRGAARAATPDRQ